MYADKSMEGLIEALDSFRYIPVSFRKKIVELAHAATQEAYQRGIADGKLVKERPADWDLGKILAEKSIGRSDIIMIAHQVGSAEGFWNILRNTKGIEITLAEATALFDNAQATEQDS